MYYEPALVALYLVEGLNIKEVNSYIILSYLVR